MKYEMVTFAEGSIRWNLSARRLVREGLSSNLFAKVSRVRLANLSAYPEVTSLIQSNFISKDTKGFGYWVWKPFVIKHALEALATEGGGVIYMDAGCSVHNSPEAKKRLEELVNKANSEGVVLFSIPGKPEKFWTSAKAIKAIDGLPSEALDTDQISATVSFWANNEKSRRILDDWIDLCLSAENSLLDDSAYEGLEISEFQAHRHDQSLLSLAAKNNGVEAIADETWFPTGWTSTALRFPIWATRLKSSISIHRSGAVWDFARASEDILFKILELAAKLLR